MKWDSQYKGMESTKYEKKVCIEETCLHKKTANIKTTKKSTCEALHQKLRLNGFLQQKRDATELVERFRSYKIPCILLSQTK